MDRVILDFCRVQIDFVLSHMDFRFFYVTLEKNQLDLSIFPFGFLHNQLDFSLQQLTTEKFQRKRTTENTATRQLGDEKLGARNQNPKPFLREMMIVRQNFGDVLIAHRVHRNAIYEAVFFVQTVGV